MIIFQENRTPDNLFGSGPITGCGAPNPFEPGVDIQDGGPAAGRGDLCNQPVHLFWGDADLDHTYGAWRGMWHNGAMDGACGNTVYNPGNVQLPTCPQYSYVIKSEVQPYLDIATNYGFANYFFQTNEGPSFPAHQFLLAGTSAPVLPGVTGYLDFASENGGDSYNSGCPASGSFPLWIDPTGTETITTRGCYEHQTSVDLLDNHHPRISWRWYTPLAGSIWTAVNAIQHLWYATGSAPPAQCNSSDWLNNVILPPPGIGKTSIPFLADIQSCNLQAVSWVIPDKRWSDHPGIDVAGAYGPSYVADLVNEIGQSTCTDAGLTYWQDTAIFIIWDDWGGFYDHVAPPQVYRGTNNPPTCPFPPAPNNWGCGYVYGFRVPLLVVSAYTPPGYVSGALPIPGKQPKYEHDFGSILAFIEQNFNLGFIDQSSFNSYADRNPIDNVNGNIPLSDFFIPGLYRSFTPIIPVSGYDKNFFQNYYTTQQNGVYPQPQGPDGDDAD